MKKISILFTALFCTLFVLNSEAQLLMPQTSSSQSLIQEFGLGKVSVKYSRPNIKGRSITGDLAPVGEIWRTGANDATVISFTDAVTLEGNNVAAGEYALFSIPGKDEWTIILNKETKQWGSYNYKQSEDVLRFKVKTAVLKDKVETFTINFSDVTTSTAKLDLLWGSTRVSINMTTDVDSKVMASIDEAMKGEKKPHYPAAVYYFENGKDLNKALEWISIAESADQKAPWFKYQKARIQLKMGDKAGAAKTAKAGVEAARAMNNAEYIRLNGKILADAGAR
ncbi:MAG: DUF2911 domain-containing protein [Sphingobacterium thalpophilum]|jgi:hypothetical protein